MGDDYMNKNAELLEYIYQNADMGSKSLTNLLNTINGKDNKIKKIIEDELKEYERFLKDSKKLMKNYKVEVKSKGIMADIGSFMGIKMEMFKDNSDARIADMLTKGLTMGKIDITKKIKNYDKVADKEVIDLAKKILEFNENSINALKSYL